MKAKLKVLHLIENLGSGGAEKLLYTNLKHLDPRRVESLVVTVFPDQDYWRASITELGVDVISLESRSRRSLLSGVQQLVRLIRRAEPDIIHTHLWTANIIGRIAGRMSGLPVISSIHSLDYEPESLTDAARKNSRKMFLSRITDQWTARFGCSEMIAVSKRAKESTHSRLKFPRERIHVLYNPVDLASSETELLRLGVPKSQSEAEWHPNLLIVGRVAPEKGLLYAIRAMPKILSAFPGAELNIVGAKNDEDYLGKVRREVDLQGVGQAVRLLGERRDIEAFLQKCDVFLFPTLFEGLGIALVEAMAAGLACIASNIEPLSEFVTDGINGVLVEPKKPYAIAAEVIRLLGDPALRESLGKSARKTALEKFRPQPAADKLAEIYFSASAQSRKTR